MNQTDGSERRDSLALFRTDLANERTLLAYSRTALMVAATGVSLVEVLKVSPVWVQIGWVLTVSAVGIGILGVVRFVRMRRNLRKRRTSTD